jgi:phosphohistidine phosphatase SixA
MPHDRIAQKHMKIIFVTHAETKEHAPRRLSEDGVTQARKTAGLISGLMGSDFRITKAVSSPAIRCIETALEIVEALSGEKLRRLDTDPRLMAAKEPMEADQLMRAIADYACDGLLVTLHADLANTLSIEGEQDIIQDGWFQVRPVLFVLDWEPGRPWGENKIIALMGPDGVPLFEADSQKTDTLLLT